MRGGIFQKVAGLLIGRYGKSLIGTSLVLQWLRLHDSTAWVPLLVRELRFWVLGAGVGSLIARGNVNAYCLSGTYLDNGIKNVHILCINNITSGI